MEYEKEITAAIGAHGIWKTRLIEAITHGKSTFTPSGVSDDHACEFGKWFFSLPDDVRKKYADVETYHRNFHKQASIILKMALDGHKDTAKKQMDQKSPFIENSMNLVTSLFKWRTGK